MKTYNTHTPARQGAKGAARLLSLIILTLIMLAPQTASAQNNKTQRLIRRAKSRLELADSLRLQLRKAADEGRMLQWGDSLMRMMLKRGEMDSASYAKRYKRLKHLDSKLHQGDSLLQKKYKKVSYDTLYIARPAGRWTVKLRGNLSGARLKAEGNTEQKPFSGNLRADYRGTMSMAVAYRGIAVGFAINPAKLAGKSKDNELNFVSYGNKFGFDAVYLSSKTYHGDVTTAGVNTNISKGKITQEALNVNAYYAFNGNRFSFPAAFSQTYIQKRSAGSFMVGISFDGQATNATDYGKGEGKTGKLRIYELGIGAGYGYNMVVGKHWLFHLSTLPTFDVLINSHITANDNKIKMNYKFPSVIITGRGAIVYSWRNKFAGLTMVYTYSGVGDRDQLHLEREKWRARLYFGFRF